MQSGAELLSDSPMLAGKRASGARQAFLAKEQAASRKSNTDVNYIQRAGILATYAGMPMRISIIYEIRDKAVS